MNTGVARMEYIVLFFRQGARTGGGFVHHGAATDEDFYGFNLGYKITFREL